MCLQASLVASLCNLFVWLLHAPFCSRKHIWHLLLCTLNGYFCTPTSLDVYLCVCSGVAHFSLTYGLRNTGMNYDRAMFGMKLQDCRSVAKMLEKSETLVTLALPGNLLEDDKIRMIASGLVDNHSVTDLDLSHNKVKSSQMQALILFRVLPYCSCCQCIAGMHNITIRLPALSSCVWKAFVYDGAMQHVLTTPTTTESSCVSTDCRQRSAGSSQSAGQQQCCHVPESAGQPGGYMATCTICLMLQPRPSWPCLV